MIDLAERLKYAVVGALMDPHAVRLCGSSDFPRNRFCESLLNFQTRIGQPICLLRMASNGGGPRHLQQHRYEPLLAFAKPLCRAAPGVPASGCARSQLQFLPKPHRG
jgi:hypothetical protein